MFNRVIKFLVASVFSTALIAGCATMTTPKTVKEQIYVAVEQATAMANTAHRLHETEVISTDTYAEVLKDVRNANEALDNAQAMVEAGDTLNAEDRVQIANDIILQVRNRLKQIEAKRE